MNRSSDCAWLMRTHRSIPRAVFTAATLLVALTMVVPSIVEASESPAPAQHTANVLLLFASPRLTPAQIVIDETFRSALTARLSAPTFFYTEYLDLTLFRGDAPLPELGALLKQKYRTVKLDLVVALSSRALRFAVQNRADLFPGAPIAFSSVDQAAVGDLKLDDDVTGIWLSTDWAGTLDAALRLQPETRRVVVINGSSATDHVWLTSARHQLDVERYRERVAIEYMTGRAFDEVLRRV